MRVATAVGVAATLLMLGSAEPSVASDPAFVRAFGALGAPICTSSCQTGTPGGAAGQLSSPGGVAVSGAGDIYVADPGNNRIAQFDASGAFVRAFGKGVNPAGGDVCTSSCQAGTSGGGAGHLNDPGGLAVGGAGDVYVADASNNRIAQFSASGTFVRAFGRGVDPAGGDVCTSICQAGTFGGAAGEFRGPVDVALGGEGEVYVADTQNMRVAQFSPSGTFVRAFGKGVNPAGGDVCTSSCKEGAIGGGAGQLNFPKGVAVSGSGDLYVGEGPNQRIGQFSASGTFVRAFGKAVGPAEPFSCTAASGCLALPPGDASGQLRSAEGVGVGNAGEVYVADSGNHRIAQFTTSGTFVRAFGGGVGGFGENVCTSSCQAGTRGGGAGQLSSPKGVAVAGAGGVYVADSGNHRIAQFTASGTFVRTFGTEGGGAGELFSPQGVAIGGAGEVYVADQANSRIAQFTPSGTFVRAFGKGVDPAGGDVCTSSCQAGTFGDGAGQLAWPEGVAVGGAGEVYVADAFNRRIAQFTASGTFVRAFGKGVDPAGGDVCTSSCQASTSGTGAGQLGFPEGVAVGGRGEVYVADRGATRIAEFSAAGMFVRAFGRGVDPAGGDVCTSSCQAGGFGGAAGELRFAPGVAVSSAGNIYVADMDNNRISQFTAGKATPTLTTTATPSAALGSPISDAATLTGGHSPGGTITFKAYDNATCTGDVDFTSQPIAVSTGTASSGNFTPTTVGSYYWTADYSGDARNDPATSPCALDPNETSTVTDVTAPSVSLTTPVDGTATSDASPAFAGTAGTALGDDATVTIRLWSGGSVGTGDPDYTLSASRDPSTGAYSSSGPYTRVSDSGSVATLPDGIYTARAFQSDSSTNSGQSTQTPTFMVDTQDPTIACAAAGSAWHKQNVALACTASDAGSGLDDSNDASFSLSTGVADGSEDSNASTGSNEVCDAAANCATAGPIAGNKIDRRNPATSDDVPTGVVSQNVTVTLTASDTGSGVDKTYYTKGASPPNPTTASAVYSAGSKPVLGDGERIKYFSTDTAGNQESVKSSPAAQVVVPPSRPTHTTAPSVPATGNVGDRVTCNRGAWTGSPSSFGFSWTIDTSIIANEHASAYTLAAGDATHRIRCQVVARNAAGDSAPASSNALSVTKPPASCKDTVTPTSTIKVSRSALEQRKLMLNGRAADKPCGGKPGRVVGVSVTISRHVKNGCRFLLEDGRSFGPRRQCDGKPPIVFRAKGTKKWSLKMAVVLPTGKYTFRSRATDVAGNLQGVRRKGPNVLSLRTK